MKISEFRKTFDCIFFFLERKCCAIIMMMIYLLQRTGFSFGIHILLDCLICEGELFANTAGGDFTPHVVTVYTGEVISDIWNFEFFDL